jgi:CheY-like chemotaxis protein
MKNLRSILVVEDNSMDVELILEALGEHNLGNRVVVANDGIEALEYLRCKGKYAQRHHESPAVILLDINMPRMDGKELLRIIKSDGLLKNIPVVMLTSSHEDPDLVCCYEIGVNAYVTKPVGFNDFIDAVKTLGVFWALINETPF